jgi:flagellar hook-associated protein 3 FlgL
MIRLTERVKLATLLEAEQGAALRLEKASRIAATGTKISRPSDDPSGYASLVQRNDQLAMLERRNDLASRAASELDVVQNSLSSAVDLIAKAREVAVSGNNGTIDANARNILAQDVDALRGELLSIANTRYGNKYIFAGSRTETIPFNTAGTYSGNDEVLRVPVLEGVALPSNVSGAQAFTAAGGRDVFADLASLKTSLETGDMNGISQALTNLDTAHKQVIRVQVDAGFAAERFRTAGEVLETTKTAVIEGLSKQIEGDPTKHYTDLSLARTAYERAIVVTRELLSISKIAR